MHMHKKWKMRWVLHWLTGTLSHEVSGVRRGVVAVLGHRVPSPTFLAEEIDQSRPRNYLFWVFVKHFGSVTVWPELLADGAVDDEVDGGVERHEEVMDLDQDEEHNGDVVTTLLSAPDRRDRIQHMLKK